MEKLSKGYYWHTLLQTFRVLLLCSFLFSNENGRTHTAIYKVRAKRDRLKIYYLYGVISVLKFLSEKYAGLAQLGEHLPYKQGVTGSSPVFRTKKSYLIFIKKYCIIYM